MALPYAHGCDTTGIGNCTNRCTNNGNSAGCGDCCDETNVAQCPHSCATNCQSSCASCQSCMSMLLPRSADSNTVLLFGAPWMHRSCCDQCYTGMQLALEYQQTFNSCALAQCLLGQTVLTFKGSQVADRTPRDIVADYFYLSPAFEGALVFTPCIRQVNLHAVMYIGFDRWVRGLYAKLDATFSHQWRTLGIAQEVLTSGAEFFPSGYMGAQALPTASNFCTALNNNLLFGKFDFSGRSRTGIAGVSLNIGYDVLSNPEYYLGAFFRCTAPVGSRAHQEYFFDPVIGNGKHWEVGGGISGGWELLDTDCHNARMLLDGYVTTLLPNQQLRSFDLVTQGTASSSSLSRYILLKQLSGTPGDYAYAGSVVPAINVTTRRARSHITVKGDATVRFIYTYSNACALTCGYNIYGNTQEKLSCIQPSCTPGIFVRKGCQGTDYLSYTLSNTTVTPIVITGGPTLTPLVNSVSGATAYACNTGIDSAVPVPGGPAQTAELLVTWDSPSSGAVVTPYISQDPVIISDADLNLSRAACPRQLLHKGFLMLDYLWPETMLTPYLGIGAEVEGNSGGCEVNQWGVFLKAGFSY